MYLLTIKQISTHMKMKSISHTVNTPSSTFERWEWFRRVGCTVYMLAVGRPWDNVVWLNSKDGMCTTSISISEM